MSNSNSRRSVLALAATLGVVGSGCDQNEQTSEYRSHRELLNHSTGWSVQGVTQGTVHSDELLDVLVRPVASEPGTQEIFVAGYENGQVGQASVDPSGAAYGVIARYESTGSGLEFDRKWKYGASTTSAAEVIEAIAFDPGNPSRVYIAGRGPGAQTGDAFDLLSGWLTLGNTGGISLFPFAEAAPQHPRRLAVAKVNNQTRLIVGGYNDNHVIGNYLSAREDPFIRTLELTRNGSKDVLVTPTSGWTPPPFGTAPSDLALGMCTDGTSIYLTGGVSSGSERGTFVRRYGMSGGAHQWYNKDSAVSLDMMAAAEVNPANDGLIVAGSTYLNMQTPPALPYGDQDAVVRGLNKDGVVQWTYQYGSTGPDWVTDMTVDASGNIYLVGETLGAFDPAFEPRGDFDLWVLKLTPDLANPGQFQRQVFQMGSAADDHPSSIAVDAQGKIYVAGYTVGNLLDVSDEDFGNYGGHEGFLLQLTPPPLHAPPGI